jgi:hypothetical protein
MLAGTASSGAVEKIFLMSDDIFNSKRRKTGKNLLEKLVF